MKKRFNVTGVCRPQIHYMVNLDSRLVQMKQLVDAGEYFTINRARQYGKTTHIRALTQYLAKDYFVISLDFQMLSHADFENESSFVMAFSRELLAILENTFYLSEEIKEQLIRFSENSIPNMRLALLFSCLSKMCAQSEKPIVLIIDEVDSATNNQVFLDFLTQIRGYYLQRDIRATFQSVILASVYDIKNLKEKIRPEEQYKQNSPWNIATEFKIDMSFSILDIEGMLQEYELDNQTGMNVKEMANLIYEYTSGYPFLVSRICKMIDEELGKTWTKQGFLEAIKLLLAEKNTLFESLIHKVNNLDNLRNLLYDLLFMGKSIIYNPDDDVVSISIMFGFVKNNNGIVVMSNRIFETRIYNMFLTASDVQKNKMYQLASREKNQFIINGHLNMELILERFVVHFDDLYGDKEESFLEADGRKYFLLFLRPIINGIGNYYIEAETRNEERTDIIIDYLGEQYIIELKIWHGKSYHERGEEQLIQYLNYYHKNKGYMLSFNFNKNKKIGVKRIQVGEKLLIEAVV